MGREYPPGSRVVKDTAASLLLSYVGRVLSPWGEFSDTTRCRDDRLLVNLDLYRACVKAKYWQRVTGKAGVPIGYFRGQENEGPTSE